MCGVVGVCVSAGTAAPIVRAALEALQHRGEEAAGIAAGDDHVLRAHRDVGLVRDALPPPRVERLRGHAAIGHTRYSTCGPSTRSNAQPALDRRRRLALAHNGNLVGTPEPFEGEPEGESDSALIVALIAAAWDRLEDSSTAPLVDACLEALPELRGAFSLAILGRDCVIAARDRQGLRPLSLGSLPGGWIVASETAALDAVGARLVRDVAPGELLVIDRTGLHSIEWAPASPRACVFEYVYFARADSELAGRSVHESRLDAGRRLAREAPAPADCVIGVPDGGVPAALGFAAESGLPFVQGFLRSPYVGRTFIQPSQRLRTGGVGRKLTPIRNAVRGKRLVVVDDSIVRGTTQRAVVDLLREAGASSVHLRIASPPIRWPCFYGFDFPTRRELTAAGRSLADVAARLDVDSLAHLSLEGLAAASGQPLDRLCRACMDGSYPVETASASAAPSACASVKAPA